MKFTANRQELAEALSRVFSVVPTRTAKPILKNARFEVSGETLKISANDGEIGIEVNVDVTDSSPGVFLSESRLSAIVREAAAQDVTVESSENKSVRITAGFGDWSLSTIDADEFPQINLGAGQEVIQFESVKLKRAIERVEFACDAESGRYALGGVLFDKQENRVTLVATDCRRLSVYAMDVNSDLEIEPSAIVPRKALKAVMGLSGETIGVEFTSGSAVFRTATETVTSLLVSGKFPSYRDVVPKYEDAATMKVMAGPLSSALRLAWIVRNEETRGVQLSQADGSLTVSAITADVGSSSVDVPVECNDKFAVHMNPVFILDLLKTINPTELIQMQVFDDSSAVRIDVDESVYVIMPLSND